MKKSGLADSPFFTAPPPAAAKTAVAPPAKKEKDKQPQKNVRSNDPTNERSNERSQQKRGERVKIRHTFDIFADQLQALHARQLAAIQAGRKKPRLGDMVQQAIDGYLAKAKKERASVGTNEATNERARERI